MDLQQEKDETFASCTTGICVHELCIMDRNIMIMEATHLIPLTRKETNLMCVNLQETKSVTLSNTEYKYCFRKHRMPSLEFQRLNLFAIERFVIDLNRRWDSLVLRGLCHHCLNPLRH